MTDQINSQPPSAALDELVIQLLDCGAVLSQIIASMVNFEASGRSAPDADAIPVMARTVIRGVIEDLGQRHSEAEIMTASAIVKEVTEAICADIFFVEPWWD